ncbi:MAG: peptidyl-prolyl cis-trans isomerase [Candidatus Cloacimonetes bacterium]|nr:peptidyl-prolyl cis-trans isomerase [Candidatus Cloacimonadota bacterium]
MRKKTLFMNISLIVVFLLLLSCAKERPEDTNNVIAIVNNELITREALLEFAEIDDLSQISEAELREKIDDLIKLTILAQEATDLLKQPIIRERVKLAQKKVLANAYLAKIIHEFNPTETDLFNYYQMHRSRYIDEREEYRIQRIFLTEPMMADSVTVMLNNAEITFASAARAYSQEGVRNNDGFIGYQTSEEMEPAIWRSISGLAQHRFARVPVSNGIYLVRYTDKRTRLIDRPFTEVVDSVRIEFLNEKRREIVNNDLNELMYKAEIIYKKYDR